MSSEEIRCAIINLWKKRFGDMDKQLDGIDIYFITGFVLAAINPLQLPSSDMQMNGASQQSMPNEPEAGNKKTPSL